MIMLLFFGILFSYIILYGVMTVPITTISFSLVVVLIIAMAVTGFGEVVYAPIIVLVAIILAIIASVRELSR